MTHIAGQADSDLHHEDSEHRSTPATANGRAVSLHEARLRTHLAQHEARKELLDCGHYTWEHGPRGRCPR